MRKWLVILLVCLSLPMAASGGVGDSWDFNADLSFVSNPTAESWAFGYTADPGTDNLVIPYVFNLYDTAGMLGETQLSCWYLAGNSAYPLVYHNFTNASGLYGCPQGKTALHPGPLNGLPEIWSCVARWIAPADEPAIKIEGSFYEGGGGVGSYFIAYNGVETDGDMIMGVRNVVDTVPFVKYIADIKAGDTIDFIVGAYGEIGNDTTPLDVTITSITPSSLPASYYKAQNPDPADGAVEVLSEAVLSWLGPNGVANLTYDLYLYSDPNFDPNDGPTLAGLTADSYDPDPDLIMGKTYSWRVDVKGYIQDPNIPYNPNNPYNHPIHVIGDVWTFTTIEPPTLGPDGEVISVNLTAAAGAHVGNEIAGVIPVGNWNDFFVETVAMNFLKNDLGFDTYTQAVINSGGMYSISPGMPNPGDDALLSGHLYAPNGAKVSVTVTDIPYAAYDLYVYYRAAQASTMTFTILGTGRSLKGMENPAIPLTAFVDSQNGTVAGNYVVFKSLTAADMTIEAAADAGSPYGYIDGFQIVVSWNPKPANGKKDVSTTATLSWFNPITDIVDVAYDLYLKKGDSSFGTPIATDLTTASYNPEPDLENGEVYYWQVVMTGMTQDPNLAYNPANPYNYPVTRTSPVWSFTTASKAAEPIPANGAVEVHPSAILEWQGITGYQHDVYFGTDATAVANANVTTPGIYQGRQAAGAITFDPYGVDWMDWTTTYYWRIDEVDEATNPDTILVGDVWSFTTVVPQCPVPLRGDTNDDCINDMQDLVNIAQSWLTCSLVPAEACPF